MTQLINFLIMTMSPLFLARVWEYLELRLYGEVQSRLVDDIMFLLWVGYSICIYARGRYTGTKCFMKAQYMKMEEKQAMRMKEEIMKADESAERIYNTVREEHLLKDAKTALYRYLNYSVQDSAAEQNIKDKYGVNIHLACDPNSPQYLLDTIVEHFKENESAEKPSADVFAAAVKETLNQLHDRIVNGFAPFVWPKASVMEKTISDFSMDDFDIDRCRTIIHDGDGTFDCVEVALVPLSIHWFEKHIPLDMSCFSEEDTLDMIAKVYVNTGAIEVCLVYRAERDSELVPFKLSHQDELDAKAIINEKFVQLYGCTVYNYWREHQSKPVLVPVFTQQQNTILLRFYQKVSIEEASIIIQKMLDEYRDMEDDETATFNAMTKDSDATEIFAHYGVEVVDSASPVYLNK